MRPHSDQDRFRHARDLFHRASALEADARVEFLLEACGGDDALRAEVEDLLERDARPSAVTGEVVSAVKRVLGTRAFALPQRIGPYRIVELLGSGGMGVVYRAHQENPNRDVALKLLRPTFFSASHLARFRNEADVLARLQHPGIAQVFEAGTSDLGFGEQPWFAMELVEGQALSEWAREVSMRDKLDLVVRICEAVEHAHRRGVVHRDLKPDNLLVTADGKPKVLDFGVARVAGTERLTSIRTGVQSLIGTLPYMSPEQAQGDSDRLDARADVYSLGVVTYELLSGVLPYDLKDKPLALAARVIVEDDPKPLSSCHRAFRGDLDTILGKALEKEPERRYASAEELASDLLRYLRDEPVQARLPTTWYQLTKLAKRNRKLFVAILAAFVTLIAGTATSLVFAVRASNARGEAEVEATRSAQVVRLALGLFSPNELSKPNPSPVAMLEHASGRVEQQLGGEPDLAGDFYLMIGTLLSALDEPEKAKSIIERAVAEHRKVQDVYPEKLEGSLFALRGAEDARRNSMAVAGIWEEIAGLRARMFGPRDVRTMEALFSRANELGRAGDLDRACRLLRALTLEYADSMTLECRNDAGTTLYRNGYFREAVQALLPLLDELRASSEASASIVRDESSEAHWKRAELFWVTFQLAALFADVGDFEQADRMSTRMLEIGETLDVESASAESRRTYGTHMRAHVLHCLGRHVEAERLARDATSAVLQSQRLGVIGFPWRELGVSLLGQGRLVEAEEALREYLARQSALTGDGAWYIGQAESLLASALRERGALGEALELGRAGLARTREALRPLHPRVADALAPLARTLVELGRFEEAEALCLEAIDIRERCMDPGAPPIATIQLTLAEAYAGRGESARAIAVAEAASARMADALPADHPDLGRARHVVARCAAAGGLPDAGERWRSAVEFRERILVAGHPDIEKSRIERGLFLLDEGQRDAAEALLRASLPVLAASLDPAHSILTRARAALAGLSEEG